MAAPVKRPWAKLTEEKVREIRKKYKPFEYTKIMLAKEYGVSKQCIIAILDHRTWQHVE